MYLMTDIMETGIVSMFLGGVANVAIVLCLAPLFQGIQRKALAIIQSRKGPPLLQPYFDLLKLLGKEDIESGDIPIMQRFASYLSLGTVLSIACLIPMGFSAPMNNQSDAILLIYLLTLSGICTLLAGLAAGSTYALVGTSRQMMTMIALEPLFAIAIIIGAIHTQSFRLNTVLNGSVYFGLDVPWSGIIMLIVMLLSFQAFVDRLPFDVSEAETEIMEGPLIEYSGPKLALFKYTSMAKLVIFSSLFVAMFIPWGTDLVTPLGWLLYWAKVFVIVLLVTLIAATHARFRIDQAIRYFAFLMVIALVALLMAAFGY